MLESDGYQLYADITGYRNPAELFRTLRPDIVLLIADELIAIELTCCFETNFDKSRNYKKERYSDLESNCNLSVKIKKIFVEVSSLGFLPKCIKELKSLCKKNPGINICRILNKTSEVAIRASYFIHTQRNTDWPNPDTLKFY